MKFSERWLRTFVDPPLASEALAAALTMSGLEVEALEAVAPEFEGVVVGEVVAVAPHPDSDRLNVCSVSAGDKVVQVVCGASDVRAGIKAPLAMTGARLPSAQIERASIRGVESRGMLCSAADLGITSGAQGLVQLPIDASPGADVRSYLELDDHVFSIKLTPNRGDCLSIRGIAREVAAITGSPLRPLEIASMPTPGPGIDIMVEAASACPRYCGRLITGVNARVPTPLWMVQRLERSGIRSISAIVDITNYVMVELGQPLHAFDYDKVSGGIHVRYARPDEKLVLLNGQDIALDQEWLLIADEHKPLALAGIMGGAHTAVDLTTTDIQLESAFFDPDVIAGKTRSLGFQSDSAYRFERGVDFDGVVASMERATQLVVEICGGQAGPVSTQDGNLPRREPVRLRAARVERLLGIALGIDDIALILTRLRFVHEMEGSSFVVTPPSYRFDIALEEDLVEEVARIHGYQNIPERRAQTVATMLPASEARIGTGALRLQISARDYQEVITYSFVDPQWEIDFCGNAEPVRLANPIASQYSAMRSSLLPGLVACLQLNLNRQQDRVRLFEIGNCFASSASGYAQSSLLGGIAYGAVLPEQWGATPRSIDFYDVKADIETWLPRTRVEFVPFLHPALHPGRSAQIFVEDGAAGWLGELHPGLRQTYDLRFTPIAFELKLEAVSAAQPSSYRDFPRQPWLRRDISVWVDAAVSGSSMITTLVEHAPDVVKDVTLFDVYRGKDLDSSKKSVAFRILLQDTLKTLTDAEADAAIRHLIKVLQEEFQAKLRN